NASPAGLSPQVIAEIDRRIAAGQKIAAIKLFREHSRVGLKEAKDRIDHWSISTTAPHAAATSHTSPAYSSASATRSASSIRSSLPAPLVRDIDRLMAGGSPIAAIKLVRETRGSASGSRRRSSIPGPQGAPADSVVVAAIQSRKMSGNSRSSGVPGTAA
ncbi:MAG TPA: hypothetical protein VN241_04750, partial [Microbacterium sp.]|nr:hypothetical protein [Microbacterium sp.]